MFKEINYILETHTYKIDMEDWYMRIDKVHEKNEYNGLEWDCWMGYIYRAGYDPMFVIGECVEQHLKCNNGELSIITLEEFLDTMFFCLFEEDSVESYFEQYDRYVEAMEDSNMREFESMN